MTKLIGFAGWSGSGKTTLVKRVIPALIATGRRVSTIKHAHHDFDIDQPGKDSHDHRLAGAGEVLVASSRRFALMHEYRGEAEWPLERLLAQLAPTDVVIVEGFKRDPFPKIEVHRAEVGKPLLQPDDPHIVAVAAPVAPPQITVPWLDLDDLDGIVRFLIGGGYV